MRRESPRRMSGASFIEYVLITALTSSALLMPWGADQMSVIQRLLFALRQDHSGYLFVAGMPSLPGGGYGGSNSPPQPGGTTSSPLPGPSQSPPDPDPSTTDPSSSPGSGTGGLPVPGGGGSAGGTAPQPGGPAGPGPASGVPPLTPIVNPLPGTSLPPVAGRPIFSSPGGPPSVLLPGFGNPGHTLLPPTTDGPDNGAPMHCAAGQAPAFTGASQPTQIAATHVGNPIHVITGNKYQHEIDIAPHRDGIPFSRHYNSQSRYAGALGIGWRHSYETTMFDDGAQIVLWQADGRRIDFIAEPAPASGLRSYRAVQRADGTLTAGAFGYQWRWPDGTTLDFDRKQKLHQIAHSAGAGIRLIRDAGDRLVEVRDAQDRWLELAYAANGKLLSVTTSGGTRLRYEQDSSGNLSRVTGADGRDRIYRYEDPLDANNLTSLSISEEGRPKTLSRWTYDEQGRAVSSERPEAGEHLTLAFKESGALVTDAAGQVSHYQSRSRHGLHIITSVEGKGCGPCAQGDVTYAYDDDLQVTAVRFENGDALEYDYDRQGRLSLARASINGGPMTAYAGFGYEGETHRLTELRTPSVNPQAWRSLAIEYSAAGHPVATHEKGYSPKPDGSFQPIERSRWFSYAPDGTLAAVRGAQADEQALLKRSDEQGTRLEFRDGRFVEIIDHDRVARVIRVATDSAAPIDLHYTADGVLEAISRGDRLVRLPAALDDAFGLPAGSTASSHPDPFGPLAMARRFLPEAVRQRSRQEWSDASGHATVFLHDDFGRRVAEQSPDRGARWVRYDGNDQVVEHADANGNVARLDYRPDGALNTISLGDWSTRYDWQGQGAQRRLGRTYSSEQAEEIARDERGVVTEHRLRVGEQWLTRTRRHDQSGRLREQVLPDGTRIAYRYHPDGALAGIDEVNGFSRRRSILDGLNDETKVQTQAGIATWRMLDGREVLTQTREGKLSRRKVQGLHDLTYRYAELAGGVHKIVAIDDAGIPQQRYRFDAKGRLDFAVTPNALYGYRYDANGNRLLRRVNGHSSLAGIQSASNRLDFLIPDAPFHTLSPTYPARLIHAGLSARSQPHSVAMLAGGEITQLRDLKIEYNANGQPSRIYRRGQLRAEYRYNHRAERIEKVVHRSGPDQAAPETTHYLYESGRITAKLDAQGRVLRQFLYLGHHPIAILEGDARYAVHTNHLGAPIAVTGVAGTLIWRASYAPFGEAFIDEDPDRDGQRFKLNFRLPGQYEDEETGLYYNLHRYYDPQTGRYISPDPLGLAAGPNPYVYADNDPVNFIDLTGLLLFAFDGTGNNDPPEGRSDSSNVVKFRESYLPDAFELPNWRGNHHFYISGAGTWDQYYGIRSGDIDAGTGFSLPERVRKLWGEFENYLASFENQAVRGHELNIDVVGFSRGAASARMFVNLMDAFLSGKASFDLVRNSGLVNDEVDFSRRAREARAYANANCINVAIRFLGLWDTVPHFGPGQEDDLQQIPLGIPRRVVRASHAVAVNEDRAGFHGVSIHSSPTTPTSLFSSGGTNPNTEARKELGFIGAHSDIGGGYAEGDLADVALMWMLKQAAGSGVQVDKVRTVDRGYNEVASPVLHDSVGVAAVPGIPFGPGRLFRYLDGSSIPQITWKSFGMDAGQSADYHDSRYIVSCRSGRTPARPCKELDHEGSRTLVGMIDKGAQYGEWLLKHYNLDVSIQVDPDMLLKDGRPVPTRP